MYTKSIDHIAQLSKQYDYYLIDLWGVVHDGESPYPNAITALKLIKKQGKKLLFLSNSPRRKEYEITKLSSLGIGRGLYDNILTAGELLYQSFERRIEEASKTGRYYIYIGESDHKNFLDSLNYQSTTDYDRASFVLITDLLDEEYIDSTLAILEKANQYNLPLICANPDIMVVSQSGKEYFCAGLAAQKYQEMGGKIIYYGKPYKQIYEAAIKLLEVTDKSKILAIGDSLTTDILGANNFGIDSLLIASGILNKYLLQTDNQICIDSLSSLCQTYQAYPTYIGML
jgi:HAD superfamily hydrolase (TIGR01459 family)